MRILILDNFIGNMGDAAIVLAMQEALRSTFGSDTDIHICFCGTTADPGIYAKLYPEVSFTRTLWNAYSDGSSLKRYDLLRRLFRRSTPQRFLLQARLSQWQIPNILLSAAESDLLHEFHAADLLVVAGGAALSTSWTAPGIRLGRVAQYDVAAVLGKPLAFYAHSFGPFTSDDPLPVMLKPHLDRAIAVLCRDADSFQVVRERIGVSGSNVHQTIDAALLLTPRAPIHNMFPPQRQPLRVGFCVHEWHWLGAADPKAMQKNFEGRMAEVCERLIKRGDIEVIFISTHQKVDDNPRDEAVVARIISLLPEDSRVHAHHIQGFVHPQEFSYLMGQCDLVVSSRFHGAILSMLGGAPVINLAYEPKTVGLLRQIGLDDWAMSMGDSCADEVFSKVEGMLANYAAMDARREAALKQARNVAQRNGDLLREAMLRDIA